MFGYVRPAMDSLTEEEKQRYQSVYCGLCRTLGKRYGIAARLSVTYDMTFFALLLLSLYEPEEEQNRIHCGKQFWKGNNVVSCCMIDYTADMTIALMYHKCRDDWQDEHKLTSRGYQFLLEKAYQQVKRQWPREVAQIEQCMYTIAALEETEQEVPEKAANLFGVLLGELLAVQNDYWEQSLKVLGESMGKFIYMMDAVLDYEEDCRKGLPNPVAALGMKPADMKPVLMMLLAPASDAFERLPLVQDISLLRNILYSGVWQSYNQMTAKQEEVLYD